ncbi:MAG: TspO/MBR family protein [Trueperaceae bacterium]
MATKTYTQSQPNNIRQIVNIVALGVTITINALANILPINGMNSGEISDLYPSLFTPAGYVFSIWSVIYMLLLAFVVYQALPTQKNNERLKRLGYAFALSCVFNSLWIFAWHYRVVWLSQLLIMGLLGSLLVCYGRLQTEQVNKSDLKVSRAERITTHLTFSIYTGWLTVAVVANTCVLLLEWGITGGSFAPLWGVVTVLAALAIGAAFTYLRKDIVYGLVLVWAFVGIAVAQAGQTTSVVVTAIIAAFVMVSLVVWQGFARIRK